MSFVGYIHLNLFLKFVDKFACSLPAYTSLVWYRCICELNFLTKFMYMPSVAAAKAAYCVGGGAEGGVELPDSPFAASGCIWVSVKAICGSGPLSACPSLPFAAADLLLLLSVVCNHVCRPSISIELPSTIYYLLISNEIELENLTMKLLISHLILTMTI